MSKEYIAKRLLTLFGVILLSSCTQIDSGSNMHLSSNDSHLLDDEGGRYLKKERWSQKIDSNGDFKESIKESYVFDKENLTGLYTYIDNLRNSEYNIDMVFDNFGRVTKEAIYGKDKNDMHSEINYEYVKEYLVPSKQTRYIYNDGEKELDYDEQRVFDEKGRSIEYQYRVYESGSKGTLEKYLYRYTQEYDERDNVTHVSTAEKENGIETNDYSKTIYTYNDDGQLSRKVSFTSEDDSQWFIQDERSLTYDKEKRLIKEKNIQYRWHDGEIYQTIVSYLLTKEYKSNGDVIEIEESSGSIGGYAKTTVRYDKNGDVIDKTFYWDSDCAISLYKTSYLRDGNGNIIKEFYYNNLTGDDDTYSHTGDLSELELYYYTDYEYEEDNLIHSETYRMLKDTKNYPYLYESEDFEYSSEGKINKHIKTNNDGSKEIEEYARTANFDSEYDYSGSKW